MLHAIQPTVAVVGDPASTQAMMDMLSHQGAHGVTERSNPAEPRQLRQLEQRASQGKIDKVIIVGNDEVWHESVCLALADTPTLVCVGIAPSSMSPFMIEGMGALQHAPFIPLGASQAAHRCRHRRDCAADAGAPAASRRPRDPDRVAWADSVPAMALWLGSKPTQIFKFRTMYHDRGDSTGEARTVAYDPRVTMVGRLLRRPGIDELPQLLNVLRGEMSLVGPRPHATHMKVDGNHYFQAVQSYRFRHRVKPGITVWAQITGSRGEVDTIDKALDRVEKDGWYVRNWSLTLDLRILILTALGRFITPHAD